MASCTSRTCRRTSSRSTCAAGRRLWSRTYDSQDIGPNGVVVSDGVVYGATAAFAFALDAKSGRELWRNTGPGPARPQQKGGGELASGFGIDIAPQVHDGRVYLSTGSLLAGGIAYALDANTGRRSGPSRRSPPRSVQIIGGGAWNPPAIGNDGTVYPALANLYQPPTGPLKQPSRRLYNDSTWRSTPGPASSSGTSRPSPTTSTTGTCSSRRSTRRAAAGDSCSAAARWATSTR